MLFFVVEILVDLTVSANVLPYADRNEAESKYHEILMTASKSKAQKHGAMIMTEDMFVIKSEMYNHGEVDPE